MADLELRGIRKRFRKKEVLRDVSLSAEAGQCIGLLGGNGSGKSTLLNILAGVLRADDGAFYWHGEDLFAAPKARRAAVGYAPQGTPLLEELTAIDNLRLWYDAASLRKELEDGVLKSLGIPDFLRTRASQLSGGMKKRLSIGCAMAQHPKLLLLDEPSTALDLLCKAEILDYFKALRERGVTILLATHDLQEIEICDRLFVLKNGTLTECTYDGDAAGLAAKIR